MRSKMITVALLATAYDFLPVIRDYVPEGWVKWAALAIIAGRVLHQSVPDSPGKAPK